MRQIEVRISPNYGERRDKMTTQGFGIALAPDNASRDLILKLHECLFALLPLSFRLGPDNEPHLTLLQIYGPNLSQAMTATKCLTSSLDATALDMKGISFVKPAWWFLDIELSPDLRNMHTALFNMLGAELSGPVSPDQNRISHFTPLERKNFLNYGYRFIGDAYNPHVTLGRSPTPDIDEKSILDALDANLKSMPSVLTFNKVLLFSLGQNGTTGEVHTVDHI